MFIQSILAEECVVILTHPIIITKNVQNNNPNNPNNMMDSFGEMQKIHDKNVIYNEKKKGKINMCRNKKI